MHGHHLCIPSKYRWQMESGYQVVCTLHPSARMYVLWFGKLYSTHFGLEGKPICSYQVPVHFPESNNVRNGELTFNYVQNRCRESGVCPYWGVTSVISTISTVSHLSVSSISHESRASISSVISTISTASHLSVSSISHESRASISSVISTISTASHFSASSISHESLASISSKSREEYLVSIGSSFPSDRMGSHRCLFACWSHLS